MQNQKKDGSQQLSFAVIATAGVFVSPFIWALFATTGNIVSLDTLISIFLGNLLLVGWTIILMCLVFLWAYRGWHRLARQSCDLRRFSVQYLVWLILYPATGIPIMVQGVDFSSQTLWAITSLGMGAACLTAGTTMGLIITLAEKEFSHKCLKHEITKKPEPLWLRLGLGSLIMGLGIATVVWGVIVAHLEVQLATELFYKRIPFIAVICLFLTAVYILYLYLFFGKRMKTLYTRIYEMAHASNINLSKKLSVNSVDEMGFISHYFNNYIDRLKEMISRIMNVAEQVTASSQQLSASAEQLGSNAKEVGRSIDQVAAGAESQAYNTEKAAEAIKNLIEQISLLNDKAKEMSRAKDLVQASINQGTDSARQAIAQMQHIKTKTEKTVTNVKLLGDKSTEIGQIIDLINEIAEQTNLLALNAAIEAARAGEHGKGFAVVAGEVRGLAEKSKEATNQIENLIKEIQERVTQTITTIEENNQAVNEGLKTVEQTGKAFREIETQNNNLAKYIQVVTDNTRQMNTNSEDAKQAIEEVSDGSQDFAATSQQVSAYSQEQVSSTQEIAGSAQALASLAEQLYQTVAQFKY